MKIATIVGARPQFVKIAVLSRAIKLHPEVTEISIHTGQHFDQNMSEIFFEEMEIAKPDYFLGISGLSHGAMTGRMIEEVEKLLLEIKPDYLVVFGDTNSTLAPAIAAKKIGVKIVHIEAGVRNFDELMPEEINRYLVDRMAEINICCTSLGEENLRKEGFGTEMINAEVYNYGDVMYDATLFYEKISDAKSTILDDLNLRNKEYVLCTVHREGNTNDPKMLTEIIGALNKINETIPIIMPIHPRTKNKLIDYGLTANFTCIDAVGYFDMIQLVKGSKYVITDSGGVVREAYFFKRPSLCLLESPFWPELVSAGYCLNSKIMKDEILKNFALLDTTNKDFDTYIFGDGRAGEKIIDQIIYHYHNKANKKSEKTSILPTGYNITA